MAVDKLVDSTQLDADLTAIANAIRTKGGTSAQLAFPAGFVSAINDIPGGGGIDLSGIAQAESLNNIGGLFQAMMDGTWGYIEKSFTSGTNPLTVDFGRAIKGWLCYPKNITVVSGLTGECVAFSITVYNPDPDPETGEQERIWAATRHKGTGTAYTLTRISGNGTLKNGVFSGVPSFPSNQSYHPFGFNKPYIFVYWW